MDRDKRGGRGIGVQRRVAGGEAVEVVAGGVSFALAVTGPLGAGVVGAGGLDLFFGSHWLDLTRDDCRTRGWRGDGFL